MNPEIHEEIIRQLNEELLDLADDLAADLQGPVRILAGAIILAAQSGNQDLVRLAKAELGVLAKTHEERASAIARQRWQYFLDMGIGFLVNGLAAGLRGLGRDSE